MAAPTPFRRELEQDAYAHMAAAEACAWCLWAGLLSGSLCEEIVGAYEAGERMLARAEER